MYEESKKREESEDYENGGDTVGNGSAELGKSAAIRSSPITLDKKAWP